MFSQKRLGCVARFPPLVGEVLLTFDLTVCSVRYAQRDAVRHREPAERRQSQRDAGHLHRRRGNLHPGVRRAEPPHRRPDVRERSAACADRPVGHPI